MRATLFGAAIAAVLALMVLVGLYNRPRSLVAPCLREFPGAIAEWQGTAMPPAAGRPDR